MNLIKPPIIDSHDFYEQSKFRLAWNLCIAIIFLLSVLTLVNIQNENYALLPNIIAVGIGLIGYFVLKFTRQYFYICLFSSIGFFVLISLVFFKIEGVVHLTTPLWMLMNILFAFFTLEKKWGIIILTSHFIVFFLFLMLKFRWNLNHLFHISEYNLINYIIECSVVAVGICYLLIQFIQTNANAANQLKQTNEALTKQNNIISRQNIEKEIMLKEIHHRVKNNLQVITSLLRLQSYELEMSAQTTAFGDAINRIKSIALIHEKMYQSDSLSKFDIENYIQSLSDELIQTMNYDQPIEIEIDSNIELLGSKSIVPLSLLFNELISNSIKHAFSDCDKPKIHLTLQADESPLYFNLKYHDNGRWKSTSNKTFGKELIQAMVEQLEGTSLFENNEFGTFYTMRLKNLEN